MSKVAFFCSQSFRRVQLPVIYVSCLPVGSEVIVGSYSKGENAIEWTARKQDFLVSVRSPDWKKYGRAAITKMNESIIMDADYVVAYWDGFSQVVWEAIGASWRAGKLQFAVDESAIDRKEGKHARSTISDLFRPRGLRSDEP